MKNTTVLTKSADRSPFHLVQSDPELGEYNSHDDQWTPKRLWGTQAILLHGPGAKPSKAQVSLFKLVDEGLTQFVEDAVNSINKPPIKVRHFVFSRAQFTLEQIEVFDDEMFCLYFSTPYDKKYKIFPSVEFVNMKLMSTEWGT